MITKPSKPDLTAELEDVRARLANEGMDACHKLIAVQPKSGPGHYYLGMNEGQLARTELASLPA